MNRIWTDPQNGNKGQFGNVCAKPFLSARKPSVKKSVLSELKNVIHNDGAATPFKGHIGRNGAPTTAFKRHLLKASDSSSATPFKSTAAKDVAAGGTPFRRHFAKDSSATPREVFTGASKSPFDVDLLRKQQKSKEMKEVEKQLEKKQVTSSVSAEEKTEFDDAELPVCTCKADCHKTFAGDWDGESLIDEDFLKKIIAGGDPDSDLEELDNEQLELSDLHFDESALDVPELPPCLWLTAVIESEGENKEDADCGELFHFEMPPPPLFDLLD